MDLADKLEDARARVEAETPAEDRGLAKFARLARKDARIRADQDAALTALAKTLMRRRPAKSERITENTLIRVAIDLLLAHADELRGSTEDELRRSVSPELPHSRTPEPSNSRSPETPYPGTSPGAESRASGLSQSGSSAALESGSSLVPQGRRPDAPVPGTGTGVLSPGESAPFAALGSGAPYGGMVRR